MRDGDEHGPKYLNTADTPLFHKGDQLFTVASRPAAQPVLVEGPLDAIAVSLTAGSYFGAASLGTSLTRCQAAQLRRLNTIATIATDGDAAGAKAAERDFWILASVGVSSRFAQLPAGSDPADLLEQRRAARLSHALETAQPLGARLVDQHSRDLPDAAEVLHCARVIAAMAPEYWGGQIAELAERTQLSPGLLTAAVASTAVAWNSDPVAAANQAISRQPTRTAHIGNEPRAARTRPGPDRDSRRGAPR